MYFSNNFLYFQYMNYKIMTTLTVPLKYIKQNMQVWIPNDQPSKNKKLPLSPKELMKDYLQVNRRSC